MPTVSKMQTIYERGWMIRVKPPADHTPSRVHLMIHGLTGDERSMEVFARGLPANNLVFFPRAPYQSPLGGYNWSPQSGESIIYLDDLKNIVAALLSEVDIRTNEISGIKDVALCVTGFSQGAAVACGLAMLYPQRVSRLAMLAGFLPSRSPGWTNPDLSPLQAFLAHGTKDRVIPVEKSLEAAAFLSSAGARVEFCQNEAGHKLPASCFNDLTRFLIA